MAKRDGGLRWRPSRADAPWIAVVAVAVGALAAGLVAVLTPADPTATQRALIAVAGVVAAGIGGVVAAWLKARGAQADTRDRALEQHTRTDLKTAAELTDAELGVHASVSDTSAFFVRDLLADVVSDLRAGRSLLIVGPSMAGKTRLAAEAMRVARPNAPVILAESGESLAALLAEGAQPEGCVIWLDDLDRFLPGGLTAGAADRLLTRDNVLLATMRASEREKFEVASDLKPPGSEVLVVFRERHLESRLSANEAARLRDSPYAEIADEAAQFGLAEYVGGAPVAWDRYVRGESTSPLGSASVRATADWRRITGLAIPADLLRERAPDYLPEHLRYDAFDPAEALAWGSQRVNETVRLLTPGPSDTWQVFDYVLDRLMGKGLDTPPGTWEAVRDADLPPGVALRAGYMAYVGERPKIAREKWTAVSEAGDPDLAPLAALSLGQLEHGLQQEAAAEAAYRVAMSYGESAAAQQAGINLGSLLHKTRPAEAVEAFEVAANGPERELAAMGSFLVGLASYSMSEPRRAEAASRRTMASGDPELAPKAGLFLGEMLQTNGDDDGAERAYRSAAEMGDSEASAMASFRLGLLLERAGDAAGAMAAFSKAAAAEHESVAQQAAEEVRRLTAG